MPAHGSRGICPRDVLKKVSRGLSRVEAGHPGVRRLVQVTSGGFSWWLWEVRETGGGRGLSGLPGVWCIGRRPHLQLRQEPQVSSDFRLRSQVTCRLGTKRFYSFYKILWSIAMPLYRKWNSALIYWETSSLPSFCILLWIPPCTYLKLRCLHLCLKVNELLVKRYTKLNYHYICLNELFYFGAQDAFSILVYSTWCFGYPFVSIAFLHLQMYQVLQVRPVQHGLLSRWKNHHIS